MISRRFTLLLALAALIVGVVGAPATALAAANLTLTQLPGAKYPDQLYLLSSSQPLQAAANQISVTENGQPVRNLKVQANGTVGGAQFGTVLLVDTSLSMLGHGVQSALDAARKFVAARAPSQPDGVVFFNSAATVVQPMTTNGAALAHALAGVPKLRVGTRIFDAAATALSMLHQSGVASGLIVLLSDGHDTNSHESEAALANAAAAAGVRVYSIGVQDSTFNGATLQSLAKATHGVYEPSTSPGLLSLFQQLGAEPANNYTISYSSPIPAGHPVNVAVTVPGAGSATAGYTSNGSGLAPAAPAAPSAPVAASSSGFFSSTGAAVAISALCALLIGLAVMLVLNRRSDVSRRVGRYISDPQGGQDDQRSLIERALGDKSARKITRSPFLTRLGVELEVAEVNLGIDRLIAVTLLLTIIVAWLLATETGSLLSIPLAVLVPFAIYNGIKMVASRKRRTFDEQLPDNLQVIASAMRAGTTFVGALKAVVEDAPEPSRRELKRAVTDEALGIPLSDALGQVTERMKSEDFQHVAVVAALQRDTGGNTAEVIDLVGETIRERIEIRRMVRGLTAQGRLAGLVLSALPLGLLLIISLINPTYTHPLFHTTTGLIAMGVGVALSVIGSMIIRRIVDIKV